jgi:hypothetical protein
MTSPVADGEGGVGDAGGSGGIVGSGDIDGSDVVAGSGDIDGSDVVVGSGDICVSGDVGGLDDSDGSEPEHPARNSMTATITIAMTVIPEFVFTASTFTIFMIYSSPLRFFAFALYHCNSSLKPACICVDISCIFPLLSDYLTFFWHEVHISALIISVIIPEASRFLYFSSAYL